MDYIEIAQALADSRLATALHESPLAFPVVEGLHLLSLVLSFGLLVFVDLRLLGLVLADVPFERVMQTLRRPLFAGFALTFATGLLLFCADAAELVQNRLFIAKVVLMVLALINALLFDRRFVRHLQSGASNAIVHARLAGGLSLGLWTLVTIAGRLIPYYPKH